MPETGSISAAAKSAADPSRFRTWAPRISFGLLATRAALHRRARVSGATKASLFSSRI